MTDLRPDQKPEDLARDLADHFSKITNASPALLPADIPDSIYNGPNLTRLITKEQVEARLRGFKIPNSRVSGDIPKG